MSIGMHLLLVFLTVAGYGFVVLLGAWRFRRQVRQSQLQLRIDERLGLEKKCVAILTEWLIFDRQLRSELWREWLADLPALAETLRQSDETPLRQYLNRFICLWVHRLDDRGLVELGQSWGVAPPASLTPEDMQRLCNAPAGRNKTPAVVLLGLVASGVMLLFPPWHQTHEHRIRTLTNGERTIVVAQVPLGYRWLLCTTFPPDQTQPISTDDLSRFESTRQASRVNYTWLTIQLLATLIVLMPFALRHPPSNRPTRYIDSSRSRWPRAPVPLHNH